MSSLPMRLSPPESAPDERPPADGAAPRPTPTPAEQAYRAGLHAALGRGSARCLDTARRLFAQAAEADHPGARYLLGQLALDPEAGTPQPELARQHFLRANELGSVPALTALADLAWEGLGQPQDCEEAVRLLRLAAAQDDVVAQSRLATALLMGEGCRRDLGEARRWLLVAAGRGNVAAQLNLGMVYQLGEGTPADPEAARCWFQKAADQGDPRAAERLVSLAASHP